VRPVAEVCRQAVQQAMIWLRRRGPPAQPPAVRTGDGVEKPARLADLRRFMQALTGEARQLLDVVGDGGTPGLDPDRGLAAAGRATQPVALLQLGHGRLRPAVAESDAASGVGGLDVQALVAGHKGCDGT